MFYNIAYGTGMNGYWKRYVSEVWRFFWIPFKHLHKMAEMLKEESPDVLCLAEVDSGSFRNRFRCQAKAISNKLLYPFSQTNTKYHPRSIWQFMGMIRKQHDAIVSRKKGELKKHLLGSGMKKLVQEYIVEGMSIFTVHLALLSKKVRKKQLNQLASILKNCPRPHLVCGDFNINKGLQELGEFIAKTGLRRITNQPTFPSIAPKRHLDLFLASPEVKIKSSGVVQMDHSDHLPVWVEVA